MKTFALVACVIVLDCMFFAAAPILFVVLHVAVWALVSK